MLSWALRDPPTPTPTHTHTHTRVTHVCVCHIMSTAWTRSLPLPRQYTACGQLSDSGLFSAHAQELVASLRASGLATAIITNGHPEIQVQPRHAGKTVGQISLWWPSSAKCQAPRITSLAELQSGELARFGYENVSVLLFVFLTDVLGKI